MTGGGARRTFRARALGRAGERGAAPRPAGPRHPPRGFPCGGHVFAQRADFICSKAIIEYIYYLFSDSIKTKQSEPRAIQGSDRSGCLIFFV